MAEPSFEVKLAGDVAQKINDPSQDFAWKSTTLRAPIRFAEILGPACEPYWWRLFISPGDWRPATLWASSYQTIPGLYYDNVAEIQGQKCFKTYDAMSKTYDIWLRQDAFAPYFGRFATAPFTWTQYLQVWTTIKPVDAVDWRPRTEDAHSVTFGRPKDLAEDMNEVYTIQGQEWVLVQDPRKKTRGFVECAERTEVGKPTQYAFMTKTWGTDLFAGIEAVWQRFYIEFGKAMSLRSQLIAIARCIRALHVMHAFTDGCGRTNIFTILPGLLLKCGFGLPLGGRLGGDYHKKAMYALFNGGFTVETIAGYLWTAQDFGLAASAISGRYDG